MTGMVRMTAAQAMVRWLSVQMTEGGERFIDGVWAIFGHGNVAGLGEALHGIGDALPTWRGQNEQTMAHAAIAFAKGKARRRAQAVTASIGPGSTNMVTAAALAHVNRLPVLFIAGDVFANRRPDPVLQQVESFGDGTVSANDCFRPVVRYFDRITRPEHLLTALPRAMRVMTDPAECGPVCLAFCQDVQAEAYDWPEAFFAPRVWRIRRPVPDAAELAEAVAMIRAARAPIIVCGGGVIYSGAEDVLGEFASSLNIPVIETQAGKSALAQSHPMNFGAAGVDGSAAANAAAQAADLVIAVGTRLQDFTTGSRTLFPKAKILGINVAAYDAGKHGAVSLVADARVALEALGGALQGLRFDAADPKARTAWLAAVDAHCAAASDGLPTDAQVIGAVQRAAPEGIAMCAAGTMPGALKLLWQASQHGYHMEYGYSCMGYEIAGAMGLKLARPDREVLCFVGDGSYMMANSELATAVMRRIPFTVILTDNRGYGCINRLQAHSGGAPFNNMYVDCRIEAQPQIDYVAHAASMGAHAVKAADLAALQAEVAAARGRDIPTVIVIETTARPGPGDGLEGAGHWWDVAVPATGGSPQAYARYLDHVARQILIN
ncbi:MULTISPECIES: 3D-(3,5/4)-trihydroxycyclohexane-1,2-dione acylhydrolase (decyclizing) [unclassified Paracoccus (in: a-proteobacteria)]|uniref:3D-(3,5/4)-trihydroxycyclohexane-1,2-dione acylhydrolase (decyclizing) n=1 Tax=unclassified Paracoccus (in: a-proteobacteria) TaxID=2688777 RepID=UPI0012B25E9B|nr:MULTISPECIES: 3D-(3,5/4)-trihydroxycyclohexane-1,2-dione acylhydrolase (decyclizing) [unclassified Paracoccus (in: a-proteobacteria)]UXU76156.1 3D-(3,5/4)-trihydroxycyclohexane-1,2-dione acylhydrolase (decyclizing) [Paracoccus sp. SMMA_5]UXU82063.1 3D-(3,5/4)-trihydroxycyclohexane-1,2-dione acylhydrolase (decyclizing) [Paracoccus sp. SMMA_5_TC]